MTEQIAPFGTFDVVYESEHWICEQDEYGNTLWTNKRCHSLIKIYDPEEAAPKNDVTAIYYLNDNGEKVDLAL